MPRQVISLSISDELLDRVIEHHIEAGYSSVSEYIRELIRNDLRQNAQRSVGPPARSFGTRRRLIRAPARR